MCAKNALTGKISTDFKPKFAAAISVVALLVTGCVSTPPPPPSVDEVQAYSVTQLKQAIRAERLAQTCIAVSKDKNSDTQKLYRQWQTLEWPVVVGADAHYRSTLSGKTLAFEGQTLSMEALRLYADEVERSNANFNYLARIKTDPSRLCLRKMQETLTATDAPDNIRNALKALGEKHPQPPVPGDRIPSLAGNFTIDAKTGRSHYKVEQATKSMNCTAPKIITFKNQWPSEIYGAFCSDDHQLISCEWGKCKSL